MNTWKIYNLFKLANNNKGEFMASMHSSISFALVNIPVKMNPIIKDNDTSFNQLHEKCM